MQLMPEVARQFGADPSIPEQNVDASANYLGMALPTKSIHSRTPSLPTTQARALSGSTREFRPIVRRGIVYHV